jgi:hypothetical protein
VVDPGILLAISLAVFMLLLTARIGLGLRAHLRRQEFTTVHRLLFSPATIYRELEDLSKWWRWYGQAAEYCQATQQPGIGQVLFLSGTNFMNSREIVQAWHDRRLCLISQSLAHSVTSIDQFDLFPDGAFCRLQWNTRLGYLRTGKVSKRQRESLCKEHHRVISQLANHLKTNQH